MNSSNNEIIWYRVIQDFESVESATEESTTGEKRTKWFNSGYTYFQRSTQETTITTTTTRTVFYAVSVDVDFDGFTDSHVTYQKKTDSFEVKSYLDEWTAIFSLEIVQLSGIGAGSLLKMILSSQLTVEDIEMNGFSKLFYLNAILSQTSSVSQSMLAGSVIKNGRASTSVC